MAKKKTPQITSSAHHLQWTPYGYLFQCKTPKDLQAHIGRPVLKYSLKTGIMSEAKNKARIMAGKAQELFEGMRRRKDVSTMNPLSLPLDNEQTQEMVDRYFRQCLENMNDSDVSPQKRPLDPEGWDHEVQVLRHEAADTKESLGTGDYHRVYDTVDRVLRENGIEPDRSSESYRRLCRAVLIEDVKLLEIAKKRLYGDYSDTEPKASPAVVHVHQVPAQAPKEPEKTSESIGKVAQAYWDETQKHWKPRSVTRYRGFNDHLLNFLGPDTQIHTIDFQKMRDYKAALMGETSKGKKRSDTSVNMYIIYAGQVLSWAGRNGHIQVNPVQGLQIRDKRKAGDKQDPFEMEDLRKLFHAQEYMNDTHKTSSRFWLPVLGLFTGCRAEELCQLYIEDVKQVDGLWVLDISESDDHPEKSVKTGEKRLVPLHPFLVEDLNFIGYVRKLRDQKGRVFPELRRNNDRYGHGFSKWFALFKERAGIVAKPGRKTFHSFRHTVASDLYRQGVPREHIKELTGHAPDDKSSLVHYIHIKPKEVFERTVSRLTYEGLDLNHLKGSRFVSQVKR